MAIKQILETETVTELKPAINVSRGEFCIIRDKQYYIRYPKAKDMIALEKKFAVNDTSSFTQALLMLEELSTDEELTYEFLEDLYVTELTEALQLFDKLLPDR